MCSLRLIGRKETRALRSQIAAMLEVTILFVIHLPYRNGSCVCERERERERRRDNRKCVGRGEKMKMKKWIGGRKIGKKMRKESKGRNEGRERKKKRKKKEKKIRRRYELVDFFSNSVFFFVFFFLSFFF